MANDIDLGMSWADRRKVQRKHLDAVRKEKAPAKLYNSRLFKIVQARRIGSNVTRLGVREIAADCRLAVGTVNDALNGNASKLETLWTLSRYFGVPWILLFDLEATIEFVVKDDGTGLEIITPRPADAARKAK